MTKELSSVFSCARGEVQSPAMKHQPFPFPDFSTKGKPQILKKLITAVYTRSPVNINNFYISTPVYFIVARN